MPKGKKKKDEYELGIPTPDKITGSKEDYDFQKDFKKIVSDTKIGI